MEKNGLKKCTLSTSDRSIGSVASRRSRFIPSNSSRKNRLYKQKFNTSYANLGLVNKHDEDTQLSDCESSNSSGNSKKKIEIFDDNGLVKLGAEGNGHKVIERAFVMGMGSVGKHISVVSIHKNLFSGLSGHARLQSFRIFSEMTTKKCQSNSGNVRFAWYGTTKDGVNRIINHGFIHSGNSENNGLHGHGIYLSPHVNPLDSALSATKDEDGLKHILLCRVIMGNMEEIRPGSNQSHPSSKVFDSGVDNLLSPKKYIVWTTNMNTHILPEYVVSFKAPCGLGVFSPQVPMDRPKSLPQVPMERPKSLPQVPMERPKSPWMAFPTLISVLSNFLPLNTIKLIQKYHFEYQEKKLSRQHLILNVRRIVGDKLLISVIKSFREKQVKATTGSVPNNNAGEYNGLPGNV
ncbi:Inactive poly [ADP-ribose] polymerase RCD1 [Thalictrum thalictroides]|uniref:Inactive poly [ADP-ribose] polymerase RCD1 n=1 Tax=Thalictrum thalictroides TaxID=46969 RepID=A0A7J6W925_THATH|nr:Inactive poly [ADP-ribose] polymerase RCD1 [Thalictrum thalictroides]